MKKLLLLSMCAVAFIGLTSQSSCQQQGAPQSASGITKASVQVQTDINGNTIEQNNVINRLKEDNKPGSIKHLYIMSAYSGEVMVYSTVKGKVTSSGKRLSPSSVDGDSGLQAASITADDKPTGWNSNRIDIGSSNFVTDEVLGDDGTYGSSVEYIYWWDSKNIYHQQYITGGMVLHISNEPIAVKSVTLNMESNTTQQ